MPNRMMKRTWPLEQEKKKGMILEFLLLKLVNVIYDALSYLFFFIFNLIC